MKLNKQYRVLIKKLVESSFDNKGDLEEKKVKEFAKLLVKSKSQGLLFLSEYLKGLKREVLKTTLKIESSISLNNSQVSIVKEGFSKEFNVRNVEVQINASLLGGIRVKIGDTVFDDTVLARINQVKRSIMG